ncbi:hypothetical protein HFQ13_10425 [Acidithiobacillus sp. VAN18-1]|uniref:Uncharacterized protein n=1 Tax=Igneacidithiobacillus copahuensis TaxID=2724909 RepID=A0AAE2YQY2_9PROT|nr:hypothetical protein [Igneacidithiobacillus copahuensis]MBU2788605.1 hypothetical protein [Igneacidithiobacillus copahuensis]MBU2796711.1 hypothetical protein [Acidithiobacillus sp. VAN18-2]
MNLDTSTPPHIHLRCEITHEGTLFDQRLDLIKAHQVVLLSDNTTAAVMDVTPTRIICEDMAGNVLVFEADGDRAGMPVGH